jgi:hypothetical protein
VVDHGPLGVEDTSHKGVVLIVSSDVQRDLVAFGLLEDLVAAGLGILLAELFGNKSVNVRNCAF